MIHLDQTPSSLSPLSWTLAFRLKCLLATRWLSRAWDGSGRGLRMTIVTRAELWMVQRGELYLANFRIGTFEAGSGAGAHCGCVAKNRSLCSEVSSGSMVQTL